MASVLAPCGMFVVVNVALQQKMNELLITLFNDSSHTHHHETRPFAQCFLHIHPWRQHPAPGRLIPSRVQLHQHGVAHECQDAGVNLRGLFAPLDHEGLRVVHIVELVVNLLGDLS
jgi:hypothetical protein